MVNALAPDPPTRVPIPVKLRVDPFTVPASGRLIVQLVAESGPTSVLFPRPPMIDPVRLPPASRVNVLSPATPVSLAILEKPSSILPTLPEFSPLIVQVLPVSHVRVFSNANPPPSIEPVRLPVSRSVKLLPTIPPTRLATPSNCVRPAPAPAPINVPLPGPSIIQKLKQ